MECLLMRYRADIDTPPWERRFMFDSPSEHWKLSESYTLLQATLLILNVDPAGNEDMETLDEIDRPDGFTALLASLDAAVIKGTLTTNIKTIDFDGLLDGNMRKISIDANDLKSWLSSRKVTTGFFFDDNSQTIGIPDYLNKNHPCYTAKLAAAVLAWQEVTSNDEYKNNGKSPKKNLINYLSENAKELGLLMTNGEINNTAIEKQIAMVANWNVKGGASTTPSR